MSFRCLVETTVYIDAVSRVDVATYSMCNDSATVAEKAREILEQYDRDRFSGTDIEFAMLAKRGKFLTNSDFFVSLHTSVNLPLKVRLCTYSRFAYA